MTAATDGSANALPRNFHHLHLELAREPDFPTGDVHHGYDIVAPLTDEGLLDAETWRQHRDACRVRRFRPNEDDAIGRLKRKPGGQWYFDYVEDEESDDEPMFRLGNEPFVTDGYVSIHEDDGEMHTFRVRSVVPLLG